MGSFKEMVKAFFEKKVGIVLTHDEGSTDRIAGRLGVVTQDLRGQIIDFEEKPQNPKSTIASTLCYALTEENVRHLRGSVRGGFSPLGAGEFIKLLVKEDQKLEAFRFPGSWQSIKTLPDLLSIREYFERSEEQSKGKRSAIVNV
jgi:NDP-sugar pyrophosphorylase family protein